MLEILKQKFKKLQKKTTKQKQRMQTNQFLKINRNDYHNPITDKKDCFYFCHIVLRHHQCLSNIAIIVVIDSTFT